MDSEICDKGYKISLKSLPPHFLENIRQELTVKPLENPNFPSNESAYPVYRISKNSIYLPRYYGIEKYNEPKKITLPEGDSINLEFKGTLRDIQQQAIDATMLGFEERGLSFISLDTGLGKTVVALKLISLMKVKSLIIVHAEFLLEQWKARIQQYLPDARIGIIRQELCENENVDISIGMIQKIVKREYSPSFFKSYGLTTIDECIPFHQCVLTINGPIKIGILYNSWKNGIKLPLVLSYNEDADISEYKSITWCWEKSNDDLLLIFFKFDKNINSFQCTENHKIYTPYGYIPASQLFIGDKLFGNNLILMEITSIEKIKNQTPFVYDIEVEDNHNFIVCSKYGIGPIVHNCHHISSKTFSSIFYKVQTKYMVGLSATPERKDGLSKVIYWFLGPQTITIKRETDKPSIKFIHTDTSDFIEQFNRLGKLNNPTMITDLSKQKTRNELIINTIKSLKGRKILVLSDRRDHCDYLLTQLTDISAGVYLGGMKTKDREETVNCSVILGTYQAAGEGFDVPELDTLILATPKSDVEQAVGRILRQKNKNEPIVIDIVDSFSIFKGQYYKRRKFYKSCEFKIN